MNSAPTPSREDLVAELLAAAEACPERPEAWRVLSLLFLQAGNLARARTYAARALRTGPILAENWIALGMVHQAQGQLTRAEKSYRKALHLNPDLPEAWFNLGNTLHAQHRWEEAVRCFEHAGERAPRETAILTNHVGALSRLGQWNGAIDLFNQALELQPENALAQWNRAQASLALGWDDAGWVDYEARWNVPGLVKLGRSYDRPRWTQNVQSRGTIVLAAEQGFGDSIQFARYSSALARMGWNVIVDAPSPLKDLLALAPGVQRAVAWDEPLPDHDFWIPMAGAAGALFDTDAFGNAEGYLRGCLVGHEIARPP